MTLVFSLLGASIGMGVGAVGSAVGEAMIAGKAVENLGRQPGAASRLLRAMIIGQAITETAAIFALVVSLLLLFSVPDGGSMVKAYALIAAGLAIGLGAIGPGFGAGLPGSKTMDVIGKLPGLVDLVTVQMVIAQAITQTTGIYAAVVALILIFVA